MEHFSPKDQRSVRIQCVVSPGAFSGERCVKVTDAGGTIFRTAAPAGYCFDKDNSPMPGGTTDVGYVSGLLIGRRGSRCRVQLPDTDVYEIDTGSILVAKTRVEWVPLGKEAGPG